MKLYPVIDIKGGSAVRLQQGQMADMDVISHFPAKVALQFEQQGADYIHVVDVDGAYCGHLVNDSVIKEIIDTVHIPVEVGGGIRSIKDIENVLQLGAARVVIGTLAVENPAFVKDAVTLFGADRIVVAIDAKNGMAAIQGWEKLSTYSVASLAKRVEEAGVHTIVYTNILRGGMLQGPDISYAEEIANATSLDIIISGGISSYNDLEKISLLPQVDGVLIGKAIYDRKIDLEHAIKLFEKGV